MTKQQNDEILKSRENLILILKIEGFDNAKTHTDIVSWLNDRDDVLDIIYQKRTVEELKVVPKRELDAMENTMKRFGLKKVIP